ncbi:MAG: hypothetical protein AB1762_19785, partial [Gemmatimonadota bacterium]
ELGDTVLVDSILARVRREHTVWPLDWLQRNVSTARWHSIVREAAASPALHAVLMIYTHMYSARGVLDDAATSTVFSTVARSVAVRLQEDSAYDAETRRELVHAVTSYAVRQTDTSLIPALIPLVAGDSATYAATTNALLLLTAADSVPGSPRSTAAERRAAQRFWERWWSERGAAFVLPPRAAGDAAASRWWRRASR